MHIKMGVLNIKKKHVYMYHLCPAQDMSGGSFLALTSGLKAFKGNFLTAAEFKYVCGFQMRFMPMSQVPLLSIQPRALIICSLLWEEE